MANISHLSRRLGAHLAIGAIIALVTPGGAAFAKYFGSECQEAYENNWQETLSYCYDICSGFNNELDDTDTKRFYYNLNGAKPYWENTYDQYELDNVDMAYACTHGGGWSTAAVWAMYNQNQLAYSTNMRLGDEARMASVLSTYACETLKNDGKQWTRYGPIFRGGLRITTGSHGTLWSSWTTDECGEDYADNLQQGYSIKWSWKDGVSDWWHDQDAAVMATGANSTDCWNRLNGMTWQNVTYYPRLRDGQIGYWCQYSWSNL